MGEVLKINDVTCTQTFRGAQNGHRQTYIALLPGRSTEFDLTSLRQRTIFTTVRHLPDCRGDLHQFVPAHLVEFHSQNLLSGAIEQPKAPVQIRGNQTSPHRMDNVLVKSLEILQLSAFHLQLRALAPKAGGQSARE